MVAFFVHPFSLQQQTGNSITGTEISDFLFLAGLFSVIMHIKRMN